LLALLEGRRKFGKAHESSFSSFVDNNQPLLSFFSKVKMRPFFAPPTTTKGSKQEGREERALLLALGGSLIVRSRGSGLMEEVLFP